MKYKVVSKGEEFEYDGKRYPSGSVVEVNDDLDFKKFMGAVTLTKAADKPKAKKKSKPFPEATGLMRVQTGSEMEEEEKTRW